MSSYGDPLYGEAIFGDELSPSQRDFFRDHVVDCLPPSYRPLDFRDFWRRFLSWGADDIARWNDFVDRLPSFINAGTAPGEFLDWMLASWFGWTLIPDGYPVQRKRRLLANLHAHYKRRYTVGANTSRRAGLRAEDGSQIVGEDGQPITVPISYNSLDEQLADPESGEGLRLLLREFGVVAEVYDLPVFIGGFIGKRGIRGPLKVWVRVLYFEPWELPRRVFIGGFMRGIFAHKTKPLVTKDFVVALCHWSRAAGVQMIIEFVTDSKGKRITIELFDQLKSQPIIDPITQEPNITEPE